MNSNKETIGALALDLKRVALGYYRGSEKTAQRFCEEALKRKEEINVSSVKPYLQKKLELLPEVLQAEDKKKLAEDALMYSTLLQNYVLKS